MTGSDVDGFAVVVSRAEGSWSVGLLPDVLVGDLSGLVNAVRQQPADSACFALVDVADEFFVVVRAQGQQVCLLLSDVTAALEWDLAGQVLDLLDLDLPDADLDEAWPVGDLGIFADLGLDEMELGAVLSDLDAYADEMLSVLARRLGFGPEYEGVVEALVG